MKNIKLPVETTTETTGEKTDDPIEKAKKGKRSYLIFAIVCFIIAIVTVWIGINGFSESNKRKEGLIRTEAVVVDWEEHTYLDDDNLDGDAITRHYYAFDLEYTDGAKVYRCSCNSNIMRDKMYVYYVPDNPEEVYCENEMEKQPFESLICFVFGVVMFVFGVRSLYISAKRKKK